MQDWMRAGVEYNLICREYAGCFEISFAAADALQNYAPGHGPENAIIQTYAELMARYPDSHVLGKFGEDTAAWVQAEAQKAIDAGGALTEEGKNALQELDQALRAREINPGTMSDLVGTGIFINLLCGERF